MNKLSDHLTEESCGDSRRLGQSRVCGKRRLRSQDHPELIGAIPRRLDPMHREWAEAHVLQGGKNGGRTVGCEVPRADIEFPQGDLKTLFEILEYDPVVAVPVTEAVIVGCQRAMLDHVWSDNLDGNAAAIRMGIWCRGDGMIVAGRCGVKRVAEPKQGM